MHSLLNACGTIRGDGCKYILGIDVIFYDEGGGDRCKQMGPRNGLCLEVREGNPEGKV